MLEILIQVFGESFGERIGEIYNTFDRLNISVEMLLVITVLLLTATLFAAREAAAWFFKVDDVKRDVRRLTDLTRELEAEIKGLRVSLEKGRPATISEIVEAETLPAEVPPQKETSPAKAGSFPIVH
jgi:hypothetical protein